MAASNDWVLFNVFTANVIYPCLMEFKGVFSILNSINESGLDSDEIGREVIIIKDNHMSVFYIQESNLSYSRFDFSLETGEVLKSGCPLNDKLIGKNEKANELTLNLQRRGQSAYQVVSQFRANTILNTIESSEMTCHQGNHFLLSSDQAD